MSKSILKKNSYLIVLYELSFFLMLLTIDFLAAPARIDTYQSEALPITYSVCCVSRIS